MDAVAALRPCAVDVKLGDWEYTIPELPAAAWIEAIVDPSAGSIVPGLLNEADQHAIIRDYLAGEVNPDDLNAAWREVLAAVVGRPWWEVARLIIDTTRDDVWPIVHGRFTRSGVDLSRISIGAYWNAVYAMAMEGFKDEQERSKFLFDLTTPPPEVDLNEVFEAVDAGGDFLAAMQQFRQLTPS